MQLTYKGKTNESQLKVTFLEEFSLCANKKNYSNEKESLKFLDEFILSYIQREQKNLGPKNQKTLIIYDVFCAQTTDKVLKLLDDSNNILVIKVPPTITVDKAAKFLWSISFLISSQGKISIGLENGQGLDDVEIDYRLSVLKLLYAKWFISLYDYMSSPEGKAADSDWWKNLAFTM